MTRKDSITMTLLHQTSFDLGGAIAAQQIAQLRAENARLAAALDKALRFPLVVSADGCVALNRI